MEHRGRTPFFFSNLDLWKIFQRSGRVSDVFISSRLNIKKQRFGFVRFQGVQNVRTLENKLNTIWIGSWKMKANRPKYNKAADTKKEWNAKLKEKATETVKEIKQVWRAKGSNSYANTVKYGNKNRAQSNDRASLHAIHFRAEESTREWLKMCYIGRVSDLSKVLSLNERFILGGFGHIKVKYLGGFHVLLKGENDTKIKETVDDNKEWFEELFDTIIPWEEQFVAVDKLVWVRCRGLPLKLWNVDFFKHVAALLGTLVEVDEATLALELEYARFKIRVSVGCEAKLTSYMRINEVLYQVSVEEECNIPDYKLCQCQWDDETGSADTEAESIGSQASAQSGCREFEESKVEEEDSSVEPPPIVQSRRRSELIFSSRCCVPLLARPTGPIPAPIRSTAKGKEVLVSEPPTVVTRADVANWFGPVELGQSVERQKTAAKGVGRCGDQNPNFIEGPYAGREEFLWSGVLGSPPISERSHVLGEIEQAGQIQTTMEPSLKNKNEEKTATLVRSHRDAAERKRATLSASFSSEQRARISNSLSTSLKEVETAGKHEPKTSIARVEGSLLQTSEKEVNKLPRQQIDNADEHKYKQCNINLGSNPSRIRNSFLPFGEQRERGAQTLADGSPNLTKVINESLSICSLGTSERKVCWVGETSKNNTREDRKYVRSALSQISNSVSDLAIYNCNRLFWLKKR